MICKFKVENFKTFAEEIEINFYSDNNIKRFDWNLLDLGNKSVVKTAGFYGPNNTGKTCIMIAIMSLRDIMMNARHENMMNSFANLGPITKFEIEYFINGTFYRYSVHFDNIAKQYVYEELSKLEYSDKYASIPSKKTIVKRKHNSLTIINTPNYLQNVNKSELAELFSINIPIMLSINFNNEEIRKAKQDYLEFINSLILLRLDNAIDITKTLSLLQTNDKARKFIVEFVKNCDVNIDDFGSNDNVISDVAIDEQLQAISLNPLFPKETLKIYSVHNGYKVPSVFFDSTGTQKIIALSGYIYDAISNGKTLLVDEIDSSLHHIISRALVAMFNNMLNTKAQLFFTTHDALLMDLKHLMRKDQIWLLDIQNKCSSNIIRLSDKYSARSENGIRGDEDITNHYLKGRFGSIPSPDLYDALQGIVDNG